MKYIIDIEDEPFTRESDGEKLYLSQYTPVIFAERELHFLTPYDESEAEKRGREEAWKLSCHLYNVSPDVTDVIYQSMNGGKGLGVAFEMSYAEAKAEYDAWQKRKNEIKVGDEVRHKDEPRDIMVYTGTDDEPGYASCIKSNGRVVLRRADEIERTGRHFPEVAELLEKMRKPEC